MRRPRNLLGPSGMGGMVSLWGASSLIKSVQRGTCSLGNASSVGNVTVTAVDMANSIVLYNGWYHNITNGNRPRDSWSRVYLQSATNVRGIMDLNGSFVDGALPFVLVEFMPGVIKSIQRFISTVSAGTGSVNVAITEVNYAKSFVNFQGFQYSGTETYNTTDPKNWLTYATMTSAVNVQVARPGTSNDVSVSYEVVELF